MSKIYYINNYFLDMAHEIAGTCYPNPCGHNAICEPLPANQRIPMCECPIGYNGDPYTNCIKEPTSLGSWSSWNIGECSKSCGRGSQTKERQCIGGNQCPGKSSGTLVCNTQSCPSPTDKGPIETRTEGSQREFRGHDNRR